MFTVYEDPQGNRVGWLGHDLCIFCIGYLIIVLGSQSFENFNLPNFPSWKWLNLVFVFWQVASLVVADLLTKLSCEILLARKTTAGDNT